MSLIALAARTALLGLVIATSGCLHVADSKLEQGESVETGRREFDSYFEDVASFRNEVEDIDDDLFPIRQPLVEQLDVSVDVGFGELMDATAERVGKIRDFGVMLGLRLTPVPDVVMVKGDVEVDEDDKPLFDAIEKSAASAMAEYRKHTELLHRITELEDERSELAEEAADLPPRFEDDKDAITAELVGAGRVLEEARRKLLDNARDISHFLVALAEIVDTGALEELQAKCDDAIEEKEKEEEEKKPRRRWRPRPRPRPQPKPKPSPGGDFEM